MQKKLEGKWALVTGSSRGIGRQIALGLANEGCNVCVHARTLEHTATTMGMLRKYKVTTCAVAGELSSESNINEIIAEVKKQTGGIDILYNNAGIMSKVIDIENSELDYWQELMQVNFYAPLLMCQAFGPEMKKRGFGRIVNLTTGMMDQPNLLPYSASKAALDKYTKELAVHYHGTNVLVNFLDPGWIKTDLGGQNADHEVDTVLPGALVPALLDEKGPTGMLFRAQDYRFLKYEL